MKKLLIILLLASCTKNTIEPKKMFDVIEIFSTLDAEIQTDGNITRDEIRTKIIINATYVHISNAGEGYFIATRGTKRDSGYIHNNKIIR